MSENNALKESAKEKAIVQVTAAINEVWDEVWDAKERAAAEHAEAEHVHKFKYRLGIAVTIEPSGDETKIGAAAAWTEAHKVEMEDLTVSAGGPDLFQAAEQKKALEEFNAQVEEAKGIVIETGRATVSMLTRKMKVDKDRAEELLSALEEKGVVTAPGEDGVREITQ